MTALQDHPQRRELNNEVHARPTEQMSAPLRLTYLALLCEPAERDASWAAVRALGVRLDVEVPPEQRPHYAADFGPFRLKWEAHTEFLRFTIIVPGVEEEPFARPAISKVPADWVASLPGQVIHAAHAALVSSDEDWVDVRAIADRSFAGNVLLGSAVAGGAGVALTDLRIHADGYSRLLVQDRGMNPFQAGRVVQHLLELDTYRILALLALPAARALGPEIARHERELAEIAARLVDAIEADEPLLLQRLSKLQAQIESRVAASLYRFNASTAYYELVQGRIAELREVRMQGLQTFQEFTDRRLAPAMNYCRSVSGRQTSLSQRVAQATQLLSTRVDLTRERQNHALLESMNQRAQLQLRLQTTVEGLSVAAITYYLAGLILYLAKGAKAGGLGVDPDVVVGIGIPVVAALAWWGMQRLRKAVTRTLG